MGSRGWSGREPSSVFEAAHCLLRGWTRIFADGIFVFPVIRANPALIRGEEFQSEVTSTTSFRSLGLRPLDYTKVEAEDRISLLDLKGLAPGREVAARVTHQDGRQEQIRLKHTLNGEQIAWFRAGSALNRMREAAGRR